MQHNHVTLTERLPTSLPIASAKAGARGLVHAPAAQCLPASHCGRFKHHECQNAAANTTYHHHPTFLGVTRSSLHNSSNGSAVEAAASACRLMRSALPPVVKVFRSPLCQEGTCRSTPFPWNRTPPPLPPTNTMALPLKTGCVDTAVYMGMCGTFVGGLWGALESLQSTRYNGITGLVSCCR